MKPQSVVRCALAIAAALTVAAHAETSSCLDLADEPHHQLLFSNQDVRVFLLELPRLASTEPHCHAHPYFYVIPGEGRSSTTPKATPLSVTTGTAEKPGLCSAPSST